MNDFLKKLFNGGDEISSKRFFAFWSMILFSGVVVGLFFGINFPVDLLYILGSLIGGVSLMTKFK